MNSKLDLCLRGSLRGHIAHDFFTNSGHFPVALIFLEMLLKGMGHYLSEADFYILLTGAGLQAFYLGYCSYIGKAMPLVGNLIAPTFYSLGEVLIDTHAHTLVQGIQIFFSAPHHLAYWGFALLIGSLQALKQQIVVLNVPFTLLESLSRTLLLLLMYGIFEHLTQPQEVYSLRSFLRDDSHVFISLVLLFSGVLLGFAHLSIANLLQLLRDTNAQLQTYSTWLLGAENLYAAVQNPSSLSLQRRERSVLFMDIRGFTAWSETQTPECVVAMLNEYFCCAEACWTTAAIRQQISKIKFTGDEVMLVFADAEHAVRTAQCLRNQISQLLKPYNLGAGIGLHSGALVEGLLGSQEVRGYDIIGDTVNTAKRICDHAKADEILVSRACYAQLATTVKIAEIRTIKLKGKLAALELLCVAKQ